jgi:foldase protein PrsA
VTEVTEIAARVLRQHPPASLLRTKCREHYEALRQATLDRLIRTEWVIGEAAELGLSVTSAEVQRSLASAERTYFTSHAQIEHYLSRTGLSEDDLSTQMKGKLLAGLIQSKVSEPFRSLSTAEIKAYYESHPTLDAPTKMRDIRIVRAGATAKQGFRLRQELLGGRSFADAAKAQPKQPAETEHAFKARYEPHAFRQPRLNRAILIAPAHKIIGPVKTEYGYFLFEVTHIYHRRRPRFSEVEASLVKTLPARLQHHALRAFTANWVTRWQARTTCAAAYRAPLCNSSPTAVSVSVEVPDAFE